MNNCIVLSRKGRVETVQCPTCLAIRQRGRQTIGTSTRCLKCAGEEQAKRYAKQFADSRARAGISLTCVDCGKVRTVRKLSTLARTPIRCFSCAQKEIKNRPAVRARMSARFSGAGSNFWKGGITPANEHARRNALYREWRRAVFTRDEYTCQQCGIVGGPLNAHHLQPFAFHPELRYAVSNGRTLCELCHRQTENYGNRGIRRL